MEAVYPAPTSALTRGRRCRRQEQRLRHRTAPVTFAEIKEVDEEQELSEVSEVSVASERRRRPDQVVELSREFGEFRRRRARRAALREADEVNHDTSPPRHEQPPPPICSTQDVVPKTHGQLTRAASEPT